MFNFGKNTTGSTTGNAASGSTGTAFGSGFSTINTSGPSTSTPSFGTSFGSTNNATGTGMFGGGLKTSSTSGNIFGGTSAASTNSLSTFGSFGSSTSGAQTTSSFGFGTNTSGAQTSTASTGSIFGNNTNASQPSTGFGSANSGAQTSSSFGFGTSAQHSTGNVFGGASAVSKPSGFGTFGASSTGAQASSSFSFGFSTSTGQTSSSLSFGSKPATGFGFSLNPAPAGSGTSTSGASVGFGGFGSTNLLGAKTTTTTNTFGLNQGLNATASSATIPRLDPSTLDPWGSMKQFSTIPESEIAKTTIKKRSIKKPDSSTAEASTDKSKEPKLTEFSYSEPDSQKQASKFSLLQTMTLPTRDYNEDFLTIDYHNLLLSGAYFSNETEPIPADLLSDEDSYDSPSSDEEGNNYFMTTPTVYQLNQMSPECLKEVENFTIMIPEIGRAQFRQPVDLSSFMPDFQSNLEKCVGMRKGAFVLRPSALELGLKCPIEVTLYKLWVNDPETGSRIIDPQHSIYASALDTLKNTRHTTFISHDLFLGQWKFIYELKD